MRILLVANINSTHTKKWALALKERGLKIALFSLATPFKDYDWLSQIDQFYFPKRNQIPIFKYFGLYFMLKKQIKEFTPDIIHSHYITNYTLLVNLTGFKEHITTAWGSDVFLFPKRNIINRFIVRYNLSNAKKILSTSHAMAGEIRLYTSKPVFVVPFGIDFRLFGSHTRADKIPVTFNIGYFKKIEPVYAPDVLIKAFSIVLRRLPDRHLNLVMAGDGTDLEAMKRLCNKLEITDFVKFFGWVDPIKVPDLLQKMDLCVYLSRRESFGVALLEAMAARVPLIVTRTPGFIEVAGDENNVLFVDFDNAENVAELIVRVITDRELYLSLADRAYKHVRQKYDINENISQQIELYEQMLSESRGDRK